MANNVDVLQSRRQSIEMSLDKDGLTSLKEGVLIPSRTLLSVFTQEKYKRRLRFELPSPNVGFGLQVFNDDFAESQPEVTVPIPIISTHNALTSRAEFEQRTKAILQLTRDELIDLRLTKYPTASGILVCLAELTQTNVTWQNGSKTGAVQFYLNSPQDEKVITVDLTSNGKTDRTNFALSTFYHDNILARAYISKGKVVVVSSRTPDAVEKVANSNFAATVQQTQHELQAIADHKS